MNLTHFNKLCKSLPGTTMVIQWGESHVHKVGGKLFALANHWDAEIAFVMKANPLAYQILVEQGLATRAPYLARGNWLQIANPTKLSNADLTTYIKQSYQLIVAKLPRSTKAEIGIDYTNRPAFTDETRWSPALSKRV
jgi:predicted DNA-binding protein (MmcQ/YjbR family)